MIKKLMVLKYGPPYDPWTIYEKINEIIDVLNNQETEKEELAEIYDKRK